MSDSNQRGGNGDGAAGVIPPRGFGLCRWCGADRVRLQYLMCGDCFRIADLVPSKTNVLLNRPEVRKQLQGENPSIKRIVSPLREFLLDPKMRFPPENSFQDHWKKMLDHCQQQVTDEEFESRYEQLKESGSDLLGDDRAMEAMIGTESLLRFILHVAVSRDLVDIEDDDREGFCVVCRNPTAEEKHMLCLMCRDELCQQQLMEEDTSLEAEKKAPRGMATSDYILGDRRR